MVYITGTNNFGTAKWIVDPVPGQGTHTTISSALASASSGENIFIRPGTYIENPVLKAAVNLISDITSALGGTGNNVTLAGTLSATYAGESYVSGIQILTNSAPAVSVTGGNATGLNLFNCNILANDNDGFVINNPSCQIRIHGGVLSSNPTFKIFNVLSANMNIFGSILASSDFTPNTFGSGSLSMFSCQLFSFWSVTGTSMNVDNCAWNSQSLNQTILTIAGVSSVGIRNSYLTSLSASTISIGAGSVATVAANVVQSTNTNVFTGLGTIFTGGNVCVNSSGNNVSSINNLTVI